MTPVVRSTIAALMLSLSVSAAADAGVDAPEGFDWSGLHVGVQAGHARLGGSGAVFGAEAGYDVQFERVVIGVAGDVAGGGLDARRVGGRFDVEAFGTIRARVGYAFDRFVVYGTGGAAFASAEFARAGRRDARAHFGWTLGGGAEVALVDGLSAKVEYLYVDLDRRTYDAGGEVGFGPSGGQVRLGLNYRF